MWRDAFTVYVNLGSNRILTALQVQEKSLIMAEPFVTIKHDLNGWEELVLDYIFWYWWVGFKNQEKRLLAKPALPDQSKRLYCLVNACKKMEQAWNKVKPRVFF